MLRIRPTQIVRWVLVTGFVLSGSLVLFWAQGAQADQQKPKKGPDCVFVPTPHDIVEKMLDMAKLTEREGAGLAPKRRAEIPKGSCSRGDGTSSTGTGAMTPISTKRVPAGTASRTGRSSLIENMRTRRPSTSAPVGRAP